MHWLQDSMPDTLSRPSYTSAGTLVRILRTELLATAEGAFFSSSQDLITRFRISRSTLRQAIRVLEHEQLLVSKRGVSGGFFAARPKVNLVVAAMSSYLFAKEVRLSEFITVARPLNTELARLASACTDQDLRDRLAETLANNWKAPFEDWNEVLRADRALEDLLGTMADSVMIKLLLQLIYQVGLKKYTIDSGPDPRGRLEAWRLQRLALGEAIHARDTTTAVAVAARHYDIIEPWLREVA
jgi:DNA-binding FadR family transcriptional regulator